ncbi:hypothetical protein DXU93_13990 [Brumimicrobium aurantiacum]|uniref:Uncharacterized protein n=2 Tax=Brumimicrobium aurantiacum TaxID=1737063 RepID=A0A3E1EUQ6_9FLAO|nr:hypothetical protein DXU93_13990 [Brumimicrobium aurantiacum]
MTTTTFSQNIYVRGGLYSQRYLSSNGVIHPTGFQFSLGTNQTDSKFNLDFAFTPINTTFYTGNGKNALFYTETLDTTVNYSAKAIFSFKFSVYAFIISKGKHNGSLGVRAGIDKPFGDRENTAIEFDVKDKLSSMNIGVFGEYQYKFNHKQSVFLNAGIDLHLFGVIDDSPMEYSRRIKGLRPVKETICIGYSHIIFGK